MEPHVHKDVIIAWANGAKIEAKIGHEEWVTTPHPEWYADTEYRVKPNQKEKQVKDIYYMSLERGYHINMLYLEWLQDQGFLAELTEPEGN